MSLVSKIEGALNWWQPFNQVNELGAKAAKCARCFASYAEAGLPAPIVKYTHATKLFNFLSLISLVPQFAGQLWETIKETSPADLVEKGARALVSFGSSLESVVDTVSALKTLEKVGPDKLAWIDKVGALTDPLQFLEVYFTLKDFAGNVTLYNEYATVPAAKTRVRSQANKVVKQKEAIWNLCAIPKSVKIEDQKRDRAFLQALGDRIKLCYRFEASGSILAVSKLAITVITTQISKNSLFLGLSVAIYALSFFHSLLSSYCLSQNPFETAQKVK